MAYLVTGRSETGWVYPRLEIRELQKNDHQWSLLIRASCALQGLPPPPDDDWLKYPDVPDAAKFLNIGGIHGVPFERWSGDPAGKQDTRGQSTGGEAPEPGESDYGGYCTHSSVLFPPWHRPLTMLIEQAIGNIAMDLAHQIRSKYQNLSQPWIKAAQELRQPYWDWLDPRTGTEGLPTLFTDATLQVLKPGTLGGKKYITIANPLRTFQFDAKLPQGFKFPFTEYPRTIRYPTFIEGTPTDDVKKLNAFLKNGYGGLVAQWALILTTPDDIPKDQWASAWDDFSNTRPQSNPPWPYGPLEGPHNSVHNYIGGDGHMGDPTYSGFDPIFYFHHTNVDRLADMWVKLYPNYWMGKGWTSQGKLHSFQQPGSTYAQLIDPGGKGYNIDEGSGLWPFRMGDGNYWTSSEAIHPTRFLWYRYDFNPKIIKTDSDTSEPVAGTEPAQDVLAANAETPLDRKKRRAELQRLYGLNPHAEAKKLEKSKSPLFIGGAKWHDSVPEGHSGIDNYRYFVIDVELFEFGFSGSHNLTVYTHSGERIGTVSVFSRLDDASCPSCQGRRAEANVVRGVIPVPPTIVAEILEKGGWDTDEEKTAIQNFKGSLRAEVTKAGGAVLAHINAANPPATLVPLPETSVPKLSLRSAYAAHPTDWKDGPIRLYGWERHEKVFDEGKWHKEA